jgi:degradative hydroxymethylglutaryl-CoA reductase
MIENCIGKVSVPLGLGLNFLINGRKYSIPMAVEEPSIVAAASSAAKLIAENGGFTCYSTR